MRILGRKRRGTYEYAALYCQEWPESEGEMLTCSNCGRETIVTYNLTGFCTDCQREWDMKEKARDVVVVTREKLQALEEVEKAASALYIEWEIAGPYSTAFLENMSALAKALAKLEEKS